MARIWGVIAVLSLAVPGTVATAHAQDADWPPQTAFNVDDVILAPFLTEARGPIAQFDNNAAAVAAGVLSESGSDNAALTAFGAQSTSIGEFEDGSRLEVRVFNPDQMTRVDRLFAPESRIDSAIILPEREIRSSFAVDYVTRFDSPGGETGLDLSIEPRAGLSFGPQGSGAGAGAQVRIGRYLQEDSQRPSWYLFAGAERHALLYDPAEGWNMRGAMTLEPYAVVGDAQAGVAMRLGESDLSFAYVRRERTARIGIDDYDAADDFAAFSLSRRW